MFGRVTFLLLAGDHLQLPPVPQSSSLLAGPERGSDEHKAALDMFCSMPKTYVMATAMRFKDDVLASILSKMRTPHGVSLDKKEWRALRKTNVEHAGPCHK